jgi:hypothetical protein
MVGSRSPALKLPRVVTYGETLEEAQANAREAIELGLEMMREDRRPIPPPTGISPRRSTSWWRSLTRMHESTAGALGPASSSRHSSGPALR